MGFEAGAAEDLRAIWALVQPSMPQVIDDFYEHVRTVPTLSALVRHGAERLKNAQLKHWAGLFAGNFDDEYLNGVRAIGAMHHRIGLSPRWYIGAYNYLLRSLTGLIIRDDSLSNDDKVRFVGALDSAVMIDLDIAISVYMEVSIDWAQSQQRAADAEQARDEISALLAGLPGAVYRCTCKQGGTIERFQFADNIERVTGLRASELSSWSDWTSRIQDYNVGDGQARVRELDDRGEVSREYAFRLPDGSHRWMRDQARILQRHSDGSFTAVGHVSDITHDHTLQTQAFAAAKLATLGEMATGLAHELNQPISIMSLAAENAAHTLNRKGAAAISFAMQRMDRIRDQAMRARTIINHLRIFGRQEEASLMPVTVSEVTEGALSLVGSTLRASAITVSNEIDAELPQIIAGTVLTEQVLVNLLLNANDALSQLPPERPREVILRARHDQVAGTVVVMVEDSGPGIDPSLRERVFQPFFTTKDVGKGTGLGLSICHGIMRSFGGDIAVEDHDGGGARFVLTFLATGVGGTAAKAVSHYAETPSHVSSA